VLNKLVVVQLVKDLSRSLPWTKSKGSRWQIRCLWSFRAEARNLSPSVWLLANS